MHVHVHVCGSTEFGFQEVISNFLNVIVIKLAKIEKYAFLYSCQNDYLFF